ncbi:MAG: PilZ domain-containing protein [Gammaproteobacteria bacterium]|nr:PilZ domain-containing protein [Gammaproteobacteria bacterium]
MAMQQERRRYPRINDSVLLQADKVSSADLKHKLDEFKHNRHQFSSAQNSSENLVEQLSDLHAIEEQSPELGRYLMNLQRQVDRLNSSVFAGETTRVKQKKQVSLSPQGIAFCTNDRFLPVDIVELTLQLIPSGRQMLIYGRVVLAEDSEDNLEQGLYRVALEFEHIYDTDREALVKHVHSRQLQEPGTINNVAL